MSSAPLAGVRPVPRPSSLVPRHSFALFLAFLGFYLATVSGHFYTVDEETLFLMTQALAERHSLALSADDWGIVGEWGLTIPQGSTTEPVYAIFTPGQPIAAVPLYLLGKVAAGFFPPDAEGYVTRFFVSLLGSFVTAATVALLYRFARLLGYGGGPALGLAATYGLATFAWPHGRTFLAEPLTALALLCAAYAIRRGAGDELDRRWLAASGAAAVGAAVVKPHALIAVALLGPYLLWLAARPGRRDGRWRADARRGMRAVVAWGAGAGVAAVAYLAFNLAIYGTPLRTGYGDWPLALFNYPFLRGLYGLTIASGKGIVWFAPPIVLAVAGLRPFWRRCPPEAALCAAIVVAHLGFYARLRFWHGDWVWGPRFLLIALPFGLLPLVGLLDALRGRRWRTAAVGAVVATGVVVQALGAGINFAWYIVREPDQEARWFAPAAAPIVAHARLARDRAALWAAQLRPSPATALLGTGFAPGEGGRDALFPRWTTGAGTIRVYPAAGGPLTAKLTFFDHRPPDLRADRPEVLLARKPVPEADLSRYDFSGTGEGWVYSFPIPVGAAGPRGAEVTLASGTWNPRALGLGERDEALGLFVNNVEVWQDGRPLAVVRERGIPPMPTTMPARHWWFNDDRAADRPSPDAPAPHLLDWWGWYVAVAGFPPAVAAGFSAAYAGAAGAIGLAGLLLGLRARPRRPLRRPVRRRAARPARPARQPDRSAT